MSVNQTWEPYVSVGIIIARKILRQERKLIPLTELPITDNARIVLRARLARVDTCIFQLRVGEKKTPRYLICDATRRIKGGGEVLVDGVGHVLSSRVGVLAEDSPLALNPGEGDSE